MEEDGPSNEDESTGRPAAGGGSDRRSLLGFELILTTSTPQGTFTEEQTRTAATYTAVPEMHHGDGTTRNMHRQQ